jgi:hypothetical protein
MSARNLSHRRYGGLVGLAAIVVASATPAFAQPNPVGAGEADHGVSGAKVYGPRFAPWADPPGGIAHRVSLAEGGATPARTQSLRG